MYKSLLNFEVSKYKIYANYRRENMTDLNA